MLLDNLFSQFKIATTEEEFDQIHRLNYRTFVAELSQGQPHSSERLVDRFHDENTYLIGRRGDEIVGMLAVRKVRPFALEEQLAGLDSYLPRSRRLCELRLLAIDPRYRGSRVILGLMALLGQYAVQQELDVAIISGIRRQNKLFRHLGFVPFGPLIGSPPAMIQPMYLTRIVRKPRKSAVYHTGATN